MTILLREAIGDRLRHARTKRSRTLRDVSRAARVSLGYLSEVERGRKEASSELLASICEALELPMADLLHNVASDIGAVAGVDQVDTVREPATSGVGGHSSSMERGRGMERGTGIESGRIVSAVVQGTDLAELRIASPLTQHLPTTSIDTASLTAASGVTVAA